jgi:uncharacterized membrane protein (UPF0127 family)
MTRPFFVLPLVLLAGTTACNAQPQAQAPAAVQSEAGLRIVPLTVRADGRAHLFRVEVAATPEQQGRGLMHRQRVAPDAGMVFPFEEPRIASFWMKNTLIPLDIIFIRADGTISSIAANTVPHSLTPVQSYEPVTAVLELAAGDKVSW